MDRIVHGDVRWGTTRETTVIGNIAQDLEVGVDSRSIVQGKRYSEVSLLVAINLETLNTAASNIGVVDWVEYLTDRTYWLDLIA